jgi:hypothetical protein
LLGRSTAVKLYSAGEEPGRVGARAAGQVRTQVREEQGRPLGW